jgi:hypothetical protein
MVRSGGLAWALTRIGLGRLPLVTTLRPSRCAWRRRGMGRVGEKAERGADGHATDDEGLPVEEGALALVPAAPPPIARGRVRPPGDDDAPRAIFAGPERRGFSEGSGIGRRAWLGLETRWKEEGVSRLRPDGGWQTYRCLAG